MYLSKLYGRSLALLTDLYQLTMAYGYWQQGRKDEFAIFHHFYRKNPFAGGYAIAAGLETFVEYLQSFEFTEQDVEYLKGLTGNDGNPLFDQGFLDYLRGMEFCCDVDAIDEGAVVFPHEPLVRIEGPLIQCQLLETALLNIVNFQTLIATKAARICQAAQGEPVLEFGLRRAQGIDGSVMAARAAYIGGCAGTSNVLAGDVLGIPIRGTHAHSWVMSYGSETEAFEAYADAMPNNCIFLVDTYDTIEGVRNAIQVGKRLRESGHEMIGIRLDSGDLAYLSIEARKLLDEAGFEDAKIVASNGLDERTIKSLKDQNAKIQVWGVGTKLATAYDQPALGGVYKLSAIGKPGSGFEPRIKLSEQRIKISNPGCLQVRRFYDGKEFRGDMIYDEHRYAGESSIVDPMDETRRTTLDFDQSYDLLNPVFRAGNVTTEFEMVNEGGLDAKQEKTKRQLDAFHAGVKRFDNPHEYPVGLSDTLHELRKRLIMEARGLEVAE